MAFSVHSRDHEVSIAYLLGLDVEICDPFFIQRPLLIFQFNFIVDQSKLDRAVRGVYVSEVSQFVGKLSSGTEVHGASNSPNSREDNPLPDEVANLVVLQFKIRVVFIVLYDVVNSFAD